MAQPTEGANIEALYAVMEELGCTENEQRLYVASLTNGPSTISALAVQLGLPRPNLYKIIDGLKAKGLVDSTTPLRTRSFIVEAPSKISELLRAKREAQSTVDHAFLEQLPTYLAQFRQGEGPMKMKVLVGQKDFANAFSQMFEEAQSELWYFGSVTDLTHAVGQQLLDQNVGQRVSRKIKTKALLVPTDRNFLTPKQHGDQLREVRFLEGLPPFVTSFHVASNKIILWQPKVPMAVLIEDEFIVTMMKSMFVGLWEHAKA